MDVVATVLRRDLGLNLPPRSSSFPFSSVGGGAERASMSRRRKLSVTDAADAGQLTADVILGGVAGVSAGGGAGDMES